MSDVPAETLRFAKHKRIRDPEAWRRFSRANRRCAIRSCKRQAMPLAHHIVPVSLGGDDVPDVNGAPLCPLHHIGPLGPHALGHREFFRKFGNEMDDDTRAKFAAVYGEGG